MSETNISPETKVDSSTTEGDIVGLTTLTMESTETNVDLPTTAVNKARLRSASSAEEFPDLKLDSPPTAAPAAPLRSSSMKESTAAEKLTLRSLSMMETFRTVLVSGGRIDKEELRKKLTMPQYLRFAIRDCIRFQDPSAITKHITGKDDDDIVAPVTPMVAFINTRSGGRHGPVLKERLKQLMSEEQVHFPFFAVK